MQRKLISEKELVSLSHKYEKHPLSEKFWSNTVSCPMNTESWLSGGIIICS